MEGIQLAGQRSLKFFTILVFSFVIFRSEATKPGGGGGGGGEGRRVEEVCQAEIFTPTCDRENEVVVIETAQYGRLQLGRCVTESFGYLGCMHDVMPEVESRCSGRRSCEIRVDDMAFKRVTPCHKDLKSYLWVSYRCVTVVRPLTPCNHEGHTITLTSRSPRFISSQVTDETRCGTADYPWVIEAGPGQRLNITLFDFATELPPGESRVSPTPTHTCRVYATMRESSLARGATVCGGLGRRQNVFVSAVNRVEIRILAKGANAPQFLLHYEVIGCSDPELGKGMLLHRMADKASVGCGAGNFQWELICVDNQWTGVYHNCSSQGTFLSTAQKGLESSLPYATSVVIITVIAVVVVCLILTTGICCVKWRLKQDYATRYPVTELRIGGNLLPEYDYGVSSTEDKLHTAGALVTLQQSQYPPASDSTINANEYATMRLLQRAAGGGYPSGYPEDQPDHIYESPETLRRADHRPCGGGGGGPGPGYLPAAPRTVAADDVVASVGDSVPGATCHRYEAPSREHQMQQKTLANAMGNYSL